MDPRTPTAPPGQCPDFETLVGFNLGLLSGDEEEIVADHLDSCPRCEAALNDLQGEDEDVVDDIRRCLKRPAVHEEEGQAVMEAAARGMRVATSPPEITSASAGAVAELVGRTIGRYELVSQLGHGGMGVVYRARQRTLDRIVALKTIRASLATHPEAATRFVTEGKALARLDHPNVVRIHEFDVWAGMPYFTMEFMEGGTLATKLADGPLPPTAAAALVRTLATAVQFAHDKGVLHRDLKPGNVLLALDGTPKITDFGLAKLLDAEGGDHTATDMIIGTPAYMSPEQARGHSKEIGRPSDVWALGAILYECLTGKPPFKHKEKAETLRLVRETEPIPPEKHRPDVPRSLSAVCLKCLEKSPARRYGSAQALADELGKFLASGTPDEGRWIKRATRFARRNAVPLAAAAVVAVVCAVGTVAAVATAYAVDPDRPLLAAHHDLRAGHGVPLIAGTGRPRWSRWRAGGESSTTVLDPDGVFVVHTPTVALLELLDDPQTDRYRFTAQVRHDKSSRPGEVGLYFGRQAFLVGTEAVHCFTQLTFNDVRSFPDPRDVAPGAALVPRHGNYVGLLPHLYSREDVRPSVDARLSGVTVAEFDPAGEGLGGWHTLTITVTPDEVSAAWDGHAATLTAAVLNTALARNAPTLHAAAPPDSPVRDVALTFQPRGGLGLYLMRGSASFRTVSVTPERASE